MSTPQHNVEDPHTKKLQDEIRSVVDELMQGLNKLHDQLQNMRADVTALHQDVRDVSSIVNEITNDVRECREMVQDMTHRVSNSLTASSARQYQLNHRTLIQHSPGKRARNPLENQPPRYLRKSAVTPNGAVLEVGDHLG